MELPPGILPASVESHHQLSLNEERDDILTADTNTEMWCGVEHNEIENELDVCNSPLTSVANSCSGCDAPIKPAFRMCLSNRRTCK